MSKYKIIVKGEATPNCYDENDNELDVDLGLLDGVDCEDDFADYFDNDFTFKDDVSSGYMHFEEQNGKLYTITEYNATRLLTQDELFKLKAYTKGQWSDGIGEGFEQYPCAYDEDDNEICVSPWGPDQEVTIIQIENKQ